MFLMREEPNKMADILYIYDSSKCNFSFFVAFLPFLFLFAIYVC